MAKSAKKAPRKSAKKAPAKSSKKVKKAAKTFAKALGRSARKGAKAVKRVKAVKRAGASAKGSGKAAAKSVRARGPSSKPVVIDVHSHIVVDEVVEFASSASLFAKSVGTGKRPGGIYEFAYDRMTDDALRLKEMDAMGVDIQVISPSILQQCTYFAEPEEALRIERLGNERVAEAVAKHPGRLVGLGSVPLQDAKLAAKELERCVNELGLKGVIIGSLVNGHELGEEQFRPFWAKAEELGATIFIHPAGNPDPRMPKHRLLINLGQPLEEAFAMLSLIYEGVMDAYPKVKILFAHGGGFVPFYTGRFDNNSRNGHTPQLKGDISSYLPKFYYDTVIFNPDMLDYLATRVPTSRIMLATDYPFAEMHPVEYVRRAKRLSKKDQEAILGANAARLLGIAI